MMLLASLIVALVYAEPECEFFNGACMTKTKVAMAVQTEIDGAASCALAVSTDDEPACEAETYDGGDESCVYMAGTTDVQGNNIFCTSAAFAADYATADYKKMVSCALTTVEGDCTDGCTWTGGNAIECAIDASTTEAAACLAKGTDQQACEAVPQVEPTARPTEGNTTTPAPTEEGDSTPAPTKESSAAVLSVTLVALVGAISL